MSLDVSNARSNFEKKKEASSKEDFDLGGALHSALKCLTMKIAQGFEKLHGDSHGEEQHTNVSMDHYGEEQHAAVSIAEEASRIAHSRADFRRLKQTLQNSGMVTNFAIQQILPEILEPSERNHKGPQDRCSNVKRLLKYKEIRDFMSHFGTLQESRDDKPTRSTAQRNFESVLLEREKSDGSKWRMTASASERLIRQSSIVTTRVA